MMVLEREDRARARGATIYASIDGYGSTCDAYHRVQMAPDGEEIVRAIDPGDRALRPRARRDRLRQLSRHVDGAERRRRVALRAPAVRRARRSARRIVDQVDDRPSAGRQRRRRRRHRRAGAVARLPAADDQPATTPDPACDLDFIPNRGRAAAGRRRAVQLPRLRIEEQRAGHRARVMDHRVDAIDADHARFPDYPMLDVLIVGAGPAGAVAGADPRARRRARAARRSRDVSARQAVRRHGQSRHARASAGARSRRGDRRAQPAHRRDARHRRARRRRSKGAIPAACRGARSSRRDLDWLLLRQAIAAGCQFEPASRCGARSWTSRAARDRSAARSSASGAASRRR